MDKEKKRICELDTWHVTLNIGVKLLSVLMKILMKMVLNLEDQLLKGWHYLLLTYHIFIIRCICGAGVNRIWFKDLISRATLGWIWCLGIKISIIGGDEWKLILIELPIPWKKIFSNLRWNKTYPLVPDLKTRKMNFLVLRSNFFLLEGRVPSTKGSLFFDFKSIVKAILTKRNGIYLLQVEQIPVMLWDFRLDACRKGLKDHNQIIFSPWLLDYEEYNNQTAEKNTENQIQTILCNSSRAP